MMLTEKLIEFKRWKNAEVMLNEQIEIYIKGKPWVYALSMIRMSKIEI